MTLFLKILLKFLEIPTADEAEVYTTLQECLKLRESYVFKEEVDPWVKEVILDPSTPRPNSNPFAYATEEKSDVSTIQSSPFTIKIEKSDVENLSKLKPCLLLLLSS